MNDQMKNINCLKDLVCGQCAMVTELVTEGSMRRRLQDMGLIAGTNVKCILKSPLGDPTAYLIRGAVIALREEDVGGVIVEYNEKRKNIE